MRIPTSLQSLVPTPQRAVTGIAHQAAGVVAQAVIVKYVPNTYVRWGAYVVAASMGFWYPITRAVLLITHLDVEIEKI